MFAAGPASWRADSSSICCADLRNVIHLYPVQHQSVGSYTLDPVGSLRHQCQLPRHLCRHSVKNGKKRSHCLYARAVQQEIVPVVSSQMEAAPLPTTYLMVNGLTGKMGQAVAEAASRVVGLELIPLCLSFPRGDERYLRVGEVNVEIQHPSQKDAVLDRIVQDFPGVIVVDYTLPAAVNDNAEAYCKRQLAFVMGTTGGDRVKLVETVNNAGSYAVIAPNMGKQVVAFQAALEIMASQFPGAFAGYNLKVIESHQSTKVDTSGTAKAVIASFNKLGIDFDPAQIEMIRDPIKQEEMGIPREHLNGHAFHTYTVTSAKDQSATFEFQHNICGREIYAEGTVDAVLFLAKKIREKAEKKLYNMVDVLREGNMR